MDTEYLSTLSSQALFSKGESLPNHAGHRCFKPEVHLLFLGFLMKGHLVLLKGEHLQDVFLHAESPISENLSPLVHSCSWCRLVSPVVFDISSYMVVRLPAPINKYSFSFPRCPECSLEGCWFLVCLWLQLQSWQKTVKTLCAR